jgi:hypothetical protein
MLQTFDDALSGNFGAQFKDGDRILGKERNEFVQRKGSLPQGQMILIRRSEILKMRAQQMSGLALKKTRVIDHAKHFVKSGMSKVVPIIKGRARVFPEEPFEIVGMGEFLKVGSEFDPELDLEFGSLLKDRIETFPESGVKERGRLLAL